MAHENWPPAKWPTAAKQYTRNFLLAMLAYSITVIGAGSWVGLADPPRWQAMIAGALPLIPALFAFRAFLVFFRKMDEVQQRIQSEALLAALAIVGLGSFTYGFQEAWAHVPSIPLILVFPAIIAVWGVAVGVISRRYE